MIGWPNGDGKEVKCEVHPGLFILVRSDFGFYPINEDNDNSLGSRSLQRRGAVMDMAQLENVRLRVTGGRERVRQEEYREVNISGR